MAEHLLPPEPARFSLVAPSLQDADSSVDAPATPDLTRPMLTPGNTQEKLEEDDVKPVVVPSSNRRRRVFYILAAVIAAVVIALAVALPITLIHKHRNSSSSANSPHSPLPTANPESPSGALSGGNGSLITTEDGTTFTYVNNFGGFCAFLPLLCHHQR